MAPHEPHREGSPGTVDSTQSRPYLVDDVISAADAEDNATLPDTDRPIRDGDERAALQDLTSNVRDQDDIERDITLQASVALQEQEDKKDEARIEKLEASKARLEVKQRQENQKLRAAANNPYQTRRINNELDKINSEIARIDGDISDFRSRMEKRHQENVEAAKEDPGKGKSKRLPGESQRDYLVRTGKITPFANVGGPRPQGFEGDLADAFIQAEEEAAEEEMNHDGEDEPKDHQILRRPGFAEATESPASATDSGPGPRSRKRKRTPRDDGSDFEPTPSPSEGGSPASLASPGSDEDVDYQRGRKGKKKEPPDALTLDLSRIDDGNEQQYKMRLNDWIKRRSKARRQRRQATAGDVEDSGDEEEWLKPSPDHEDTVFADGLKLPGDIGPSLFSYQKIGVQWLAELYTQKVGGIVGDEMGLGKTIQVIAFIAALHHSKMLDKPVIVVAPATVLRQWVNEFHKWWPALRVSILHSSGSGMLNVRYEDDSEIEDDRRASVQSKAGRRIVKRVATEGGVLVTTYNGLQTYADELVDVDWSYAVLDEGHKIRNPNAEITVTCKELNTPNRIILSGTPVQNNLSELWSLFDFVFPMRLGTLVNFRTQFEIPIRQGGYANATNLQILTAEKCAETLKETISQYLLQRLKIDVAADLPAKTEQVLFCKLTESQHSAYTRFLNSDECGAILNRRRQALYGIDILRKICNHPDLLDARLASKPGYEWGAPKKSGKLQVVQALLQMWTKNGHKTLLFSQSKQMLNILERFIGYMDGVAHVRMDGETPVDKRQYLIDRFNNDPDIHVFLLTTRTGGLGVNLTGADRIIIYDPDWNPSTDMQARERAWRLGQTKPVSIYRLMTSGTIEEKIYHRQVFKQFMTNKVLKDPKQRAAFDLTDLYDLFTLGNAKGGKGGVDRSRIFDGAEVDFNEKSTAPEQDPSEAIMPITSIKEEEGDGPGRDEVRNVEKFAGVASMEEFQEEQEVHDEKRMIDGIFSRQVESAYDHEAVMSGKKKPQADRAMNLQEANRVARTAAAHLNRSGREARNIQVGEVTWTGSVGTAGRPGRRRGTGPSSSGIMSGLANRQNLAGQNGGSGASSGSSTPVGAARQSRNLKFNDFVDMITEFLKRQGGKAPSKMLVDHFNQYCEGRPRQTEDFKRALDVVAVLGKTGSAGRGMWSLKPGY